MSTSDEEVGVEVEDDVYEEGEESKEERRASSQEGNRAGITETQSDIANEGK